MIKRNKKWHKEEEGIREKKKERRASDALGAFSSVSIIQDTLSCEKNHRNDHPVDIF